MANLQPYYDRIISDEDKPLFNEAVVSADAGALRGSYILVWLSAAEGLKRKFYDAQQRDAAAAVHIGKIETAEASRSSADMIILSAAKRYGLVSDTAFQKLQNIYDLRCVFGHPYEAAPTEVELLGAAEIVTTEVLAKPTLLRREYIQGLIKNLYTDINWLAQTRAAVQSYAEEITPRIDPGEYGFLVTEYAKRLEPTASDPAYSVITARGRWFIAALMAKAGSEFFTPTQWHAFVSSYPHLAQFALLTSPLMIEQVGQRAKQSVISFILTNANIYPKRLKKLENLCDAGLLEEHQIEALTSLDINTAAAAQLKLKTSINTVLAGLKHHHWPAQNPAAQYVKLAGADQIGELSEPNQEQLGRNILQAADGSSNDAIACLYSYDRSRASLPPAYVKGLVFECFLNEQPKFRLKIREMAVPLELLQYYPDIKTELESAIANVEPPEWVPSRDFDKTLELIADKPALASLNDVLVAHRPTLETYREQHPAE